MSSTETTLTNDLWRFVGSPQWIDGSRGHLLRSLYELTDDEEIVAENLSVITGRLQSILRKWDDRLSWALTGDQLFQTLMDHVVTHMRSRIGIAIGPFKRAVKPVGWSDEDEQIWIEWLGSEVLSPERLDRIVFGEEPCVWELRLGDSWRREVIAYLPYLVNRSREILREVDPRPIMAEDEFTTISEEDGRRR